MNKITDTDILELLLSPQEVDLLSRTPEFYGLDKQKILQKFRNSQIDVYQCLGYSGLEDYVRDCLKRNNASLDEFAQEVVAMTYDDATIEGQAEIQSMLNCYDETTLDEMLDNQEYASIVFDKVYLQNQGAKTNSVEICDLYSLYYFSAKICIGKDENLTC